MRTFFLALLFILTFLNPTKSDLSNNDNLQIKLKIVYPKQGTSLGSYYNVENIIAIEVINDWKNSKKILSGKKLDEFKKIMKTCVYRIGLETKPGHIFIKVKFKGESKWRNDFIYLNSAINFDYGINKYGEKFSGTFRTSRNVNFEKY